MEFKDAFRKELRKIIAGTFHVCTSEEVARVDESVEKVMTLINDNAPIEFMDGNTINVKGEVIDIGEFNRKVMRGEYK